MADKFFVDGLVDADWNGSDNWSSSSGGGGGAGAPGVSDDAHLDGNSPALCDLNTNVNCDSLDTTGYSGVMDFNNGDHYLRVYGDVTISATTTWNVTGGTGKGYLHFYYWHGHDTLVNISSSATLHMSIVWGGANTSPEQTWTIEQSFSFDGQFLTFGGLVSHTSYDWIINQTGASVVTWNPTDGDCYYGGNPGGSWGEVRGNAVWKITGTVNFRFTNASDSYQITQKFEVATGGAVTLFGQNNGVICRMGGGFEMIITGSGTVVGDPVDTPIPYFYHVNGSGSDTTVAFEDGFEYRMYFRQSSGTQYWKDSSPGISICVFVKNYVTGSKIIASDNGKWRVNIYESTSSASGILYFRGDSGIFFGTFLVKTTASVDWDIRWGYNAGDAERWEFQSSLRVHPFDGDNYGEYEWLGEDASLKSRFLIWHECRTDVTNSSFEKCDFLSEGQPLHYGGEGVITNTTGVQDHRFNLSVWQDDGTTVSPHTYYFNEIYDPVTVSGTVELSATPQANARVHVITGQVDPDGVEWFMLRQVLITNGSGEWTCSVPKDSIVYVSAHYDSGGTKYNSLSKPFIDAS